MNAREEIIQPFREELDSLTEELESEYLQLSADNQMRANWYITYGHEMIDSVLAEKDWDIHLRDHLFEVGDGLMHDYELDSTVFEAQLAVSDILVRLSHAI